ERHAPVLVPGLDRTRARGRPRRRRRELLGAQRAQRAARRSRGARDVYRGAAGRVRARVRARGRYAALGRLPADRPAQGRGLGGAGRVAARASDPMMRRTPTPPRHHGRIVHLALAALALGACASGSGRTDELLLETVVEGLERPVDLCSPPGDSRVFVVEKVGRIRILERGKLRPTPFLDVHDQVSRGNEQGLLGVAFHPRYADNGLFFINYTN